MWTINDFLAYWMVSSWSTHGKLTCPYCMENNKAFTLINKGKMSFFYCHRRFLWKGFFYWHSWKGYFTFVSFWWRIVWRGVKVWCIVFGFQSGKQNFLGFGLTYNWVKQSIFWELSYWKTNLLCYNLDVMHIEKNVFENIFNTVMDVKGKTKDDIKARMDITLFCHCKNMELVCDGSRVVKPKARFALEKNTQLLVYQWHKSLHFPDGHASNILRLVDLKDCRLYGMKSHDFYVFMKTLISLTYHDLLL